MTKTCWLWCLLALGGLLVQPAKGQNRFPAAWQGAWKGTLEIYNAKGQVVQRVPMELNIAPGPQPQRWQWQTIYNRQDVRNYELVVQDSASGKYTIDEKNSIVLDVRLFANKAFCSFEVQGYHLFNTYTLAGNEIVFEISSASRQAANVSGEGTEERPEVKSYPQASYQRAVLQRAADK